MDEVNGNKRRRIKEEDDDYGRLLNGVHSVLAEGEGGRHRDEEHPTAAAAVDTPDATAPVLVGVKERPPKIDSEHLEAARAVKLLVRREPASGSGADVDALGKTPPKKRRKVGHACVYCRRSHMTCDLERPCERCRSRGIGHICHDEPRAPAEGKKPKPAPPMPIQIPTTPATGTTSSPDVLSQHSDSRRPSLQQHQAQGHVVGPMGPPPHYDAPSSAANAGGTPAPGTRSVTPTSATAPPNLGGRINQTGAIPLVSPGGGALGTTGQNPNEFHRYSNPNVWMSSPNQFLQMHNYPTAYMLPSDVEATHEFGFLNDFLYHTLNGQARAPSDDGSQTPNVAQGPSSQVDILGAFASQPGSSSKSDSRLHPNSSSANNAAESSSLSVPNHASARQNPSKPLFNASYSMNPDKARDRYYLQAADPSGSDHQTPEQRIKSLLDHKYHAGLLKPFNYVSGYQRLHKYLESGAVAQTSRTQIARSINTFRPRFRELAQRLSDKELIYVEMWFERQLMEYDRIFASMAVPACCWRRTGEIYRANREMAELVGVPVDRLRDGKLSLHEILTEESLVRYWEEFGTIAFDDHHDTLLSACELKHPTDETKPTVKCAFSFMIRWDEHKIPTLIVGNFLPHDPAE